MRNIKKNLPYFAATSAFLALAAFVLFLTLQPAPENEPSSQDCNPIAEVQKRQEDPILPPKLDENSSTPAPSASAEEPEEPLPKPPPEVPAEDEDSEKSSEFFSQLEKWSDSEKNKATESDAKEFIARFKSLPPALQEENLNHALNLIPDANIILLTGLLFDKTIQPEFNELIFNDILNRDESIKLPIIRQVHKDRAHPCWSDAAWILDVTSDATTP